MIKILFVTSGMAVAFTALAVPAAHAADPVVCSNFGAPVVLSNGYNPLHLPDEDHDGIVCEGLPGKPTKTDLYADLKGEGDTNPQPPLSPSAPPTLAHTGAGDVVQRHPLRVMGVAGALIVVGGGAFVVVRRRQS